MWRLLNLVLVFLTVAIVLASGAAADNMPGVDYRAVLTGQVSQNRGRLPVVLPGQISQDQGRLSAAALPPIAPSFRRTSASIAGESAGSGNYGGVVNVSQFSGQVQKSQLSGQVQSAQLSGQAQKFQSSAQQQKGQASAQIQNPSSSNRVFASRAEMEAVGVGLNAAGLGALHCPICRLLKGF